MSLYAIGDLHLHFHSELKAPNQLTDPLWVDHERIFKENCERLLTEEDTLVLVGDHSWGRNLEECGPDLEYIESLPGEKILIRGNHDMFWDAKKTEALNDLYEDRLFFLQNNYASYGPFALVGTKGFTFEGPFYVNEDRRIVGWDEAAADHAEKLIERELIRLRASFDAAERDGYSRFIMFLHYPPTNIVERFSAFTALAEEYRAEQVIYAHSHGERRFHDSLEGVVNGIRYTLVSGDKLHWCPYKVI